MTNEKNPWWMHAILVVLAALLPVLAMLQYRWIGAVSDGEATRMQRTLRAGVLRFADDFDRPLEHLQETFLFGTLPAPETLALHLTRHYQRWLADTPFPALIKTVYQVDYDGDHRPRLHRLDTATVALVPEAWPEALAPWRTFFIQAAASEAAAPKAQAEAFPPAQPSGLSIPLLPSPRFGLPELRPPQTQPSHLLLLLNEPYLSQTVFPTLARTYFLDHDDTYNLLIVHRDNPQHVVYRSSPTLTAADFTAPDALADLGRANQVNVTRYITDDGDGTKVTVERQDTTATGLETDVEVVVTRNAETILLKTNDPDEITRASSAQRARTGPGLLQTQAHNTVHPWRLLIQHKAGSIGAAITTMRRRTLGIGFGILMLLGGAAAMLFVAARRARRLAEQQMAFVAGVTHELRTPLAVIRSAAENLADGVITDPTQARRYGTLIHEEGRRLSEVVEQALALAGAHANHAPPDLHLIAIGPLIEQALDRCRPTLGEEPTAITTTIPDDLPPVRADAQALEAALCNLITNACKYGEGEIAIEAQPEPHGTGGVQITVRDQGPGIPADELPHLFKPFYRGRAARQAQIRGSGLGLSLVKNTIEAHGGQIAVESTPNQGSTFTIHLPVAP